MVLLRLLINKRIPLHRHEPLHAVLKALCKSPKRLRSDKGRIELSLTVAPAFINSTFVIMSCIGVCIYCKKARGAKP